MTPSAPATLLEAAPAAVTDGVTIAIFPPHTLVDKTTQPQGPESERSSVMGVLEPASSNEAAAEPEATTPGSAYEPNPESALQTTGEHRSTPRAGHAAPTIMQRVTRLQPPVR